MLLSLLPNLVFVMERRCVMSFVLKWVNRSFLTSFEIDVSSIFDFMICPSFILFYNISSSLISLNELQVNSSRYQLFYPLKHRTIKEATISLVKINHHVKEEFDCTLIKWMICHDNGERSDT